MNIVLFFAMWILKYVGQVYIVCVPLEDQSYGVMMGVQQINLDQSYGSCTKDQSYEDRRHACYNEPDVCTKDQSYGTVHVATCTYARSQVKDLCQV